MNDSLRKKENIMKKKVELDDDDSSSDSDTSLHDMRCDTCDLNFSSLKTYTDHMKGKRHQKTAAQVKILSKLAISDKEKADDNESDDDDEDSIEMYCEVCDKYMSGYVSYVTHLKGSRHTKNIKKQKLKMGMKGMPEVLEKENEENNENDDEILQNVFARCDTCQKSFSGPEPFHMHLKSAAHKKKMQQSKVLESLKTKLPDESKSDDEDCFSKCSVCNKAFSGLVPYQMHMQSNIHKKNLEKLKLIEEIKEFFSTDENAYICKECKKKFTDPKNFKYHLTNNSHEKRKAKKVLSEFLASYPEITFVTPFRDDDSGDENNTDDSDEAYYLICKICHVSFCGPESAEDHVKSKKHVKLKKEKKMLKILKKQKKESKDSSEVNDKKEAKNSSEVNDKKEAKDSSEVNDKKEVSRDSATGYVEKKHVKSSVSTNRQTSQSRRSRLPSEDGFEIL